MENFTEKTFKTYEEQIEILKSRGMLFVNETTTKQCLEKYNYYDIINGYKDKFLASTEPEYYIEGLYFEHIFNLFQLDNLLKLNSLTFLLDIEKTLRSVITYEFARIHGESSYWDATSYAPYKDNHYRDDVITRFNEIKSNAQSEKYIKDTRYNAIRNCLDKNRPIPIWVMFTVIDMGTLSKFYCALQLDTKKAIAKHIVKIYNTPMNSKDLSNALRIMTDIRNICAHNQRLIYYKPSIRLSHNNYLVQKYYGDKYTLDTLGNINCLFIVLAQLTDNSTFYAFLEGFIDYVKELYKNVGDSMYSYILNKTGIDLDLILKLLGSATNLTIN